MHASVTYMKGPRIPKDVMREDTVELSTWNPTEAAAVMKYKVSRDLLDVESDAKQYNETLTEVRIIITRE